MNKVELIGRMTKDPDIRMSGGEKAQVIARFTLAVDRKFKRDEADFITCVAFGKTGEFLEKYGHKGLKLALVGHIQTGSYTKQDGTKVYTTDVIADEVEFVESKAAASQQVEKPRDNGFMNVPDGVDDEFPFK